MKDRIQDTRHNTRGRTPLRTHPIRSPAYAGVGQRTKGECWSRTRGRTPPRTLGKCWSRRLVLPCNQKSRFQWVHGFTCLSAYKSISSLCILSLVSLLLFITASEAKIVEKVLVIVNDDIVTKTELDERLLRSKEELRQLYQLQGIRYDEAQLSEEMEKNRPEILELMINDLLFIQEAVKRGIQVSDTDIQEEINKLKNQFGSEDAFRKALEAEGYTLDSLKKEQKRALLLKQFIDLEFGSELDITYEEVRKFYRENRDQFGSRSDTVKLKRIFIKFRTTKADKEKTLRKAENILKRCREEADFGEMASKFSDHDITRESGGDMGYFIPGMGKYDPKLEEAASQLAVGEISNLIETPGGYDIIKVTDIKDLGSPSARGKKEVRAQRIYIAIYPDPTSERTAEEKANAILEELKKGADFVALVKKYSDDPQTRDRGGDWEEVSIDTMTPDLREAFDSFDEGEISRPVKTPHGIHIFKVSERQDLSDDEVEQLRRRLQQKRLDEELSEYSKKLREKAYIHYIQKPAEQ
jgi:peptidyl-prolyl cis-trans isomerase SurA